MRIHSLLSMKRASIDPRLGTATDVDETRPSAIHIIRFNLAGIAALLLLAACATPLTRTSREEVAAAPERSPFVQNIDGAVVSFEMVPMSVEGDDGAARTLWIGRTEVTWDLFDLFVFGLAEDDDSAEADAVARPSKPYIPMDRGFGHAGYPAISMSYHSARKFCEWLSMKTGRQYRLPTEEEWRIACIAGAVKGEDLDAHAWHKFNADASTHPVASKEASGLGTHDMLGNAAEWATDSEGEAVALGGSYQDPPSQIGCDVETRPEESWNASDPQIPRSIWWYADQAFVGLRLVCDPDPHP